MREPGGRFAEPGGRLNKLNVEPRNISYAKQETTTDIIHLVAPTSGRGFGRRCRLGGLDTRRCMTSTFQRASTANGIGMLSADDPDGEDREEDCENDLS